MHLPTGPKKTVPLSRISISDEYYPRNGVDWLTVFHYTNKMRAGEKFPPLLVGKSRHTGPDLQLLDGMHRFKALLKLKRSVAEVVELRKPKEDWFAASVYMNLGHGKSLAPFEVANCVTRMRQEGKSEKYISSAVRMRTVEVVKLMASKTMRLNGAILGLKKPLSCLMKGDNGYEMLQTAFPESEKLAVQQKYMIGESIERMAQELTGLISQGLADLGNEVVFEALTELNTALMRLFGIGSAVKHKQQRVRDMGRKHGNASMLKQGFGRA